MKTIEIELKERLRVVVVVLIATRVIINGTDSSFSKIEEKRKRRRKFVHD